MGKLGFILIIAHLGQQVNTYAAQDYVRYCFVPAENEEAIVPKESERRCVWQAGGTLSRSKGVERHAQGQNSSGLPTLTM